jgi:hypothetical protein
MIRKASAKVILHLLTCVVVQHLQAHVQELRGQADAYQNEFNVKRNERK